MYLLLMHTDSICPKAHMCNTLLTHYSPNRTFTVFLWSCCLPEHDHSSGNESLSVTRQSEDIKTLHVLEGKERQGEKKQREDKRRKSWGDEKWKIGFCLGGLKKLTIPFCVSTAKSMGGMEGQLNMNFNGLAKLMLKLSVNLKLIHTFI